MVYLRSNNRKFAFAQSSGLVFWLVCIAFLLPSCKAIEDQIFGAQAPITVTATLDKPEGRYDSLPESIEFEFPDELRVSSISTEDFSITDTCNSGDPKILSVTTEGQIATLTLGEVSGCANGEAMTITLDYLKVYMKTRDQKPKGKVKYIYTRDTAAPSFAATINTVSQLTTSQDLAFTSVPTSITYSFASDVNLDSIATTDFLISTTGNTDCAMMPTLSTLSKSATSVMLSLGGSNCADGQSFRISLLANAIGDSTRSGVSGIKAPRTGPSANLGFNISYFANGVSVVSVGNGASSSNGTYGVGQVLDLVVTFDGPVTVAGAPSLRLNITGSAVRYATYFSGSGTNQLIFRYTIQSGDSVADLNYSSTSALSLNGGTMIRTGSGGGIMANLVLPSTSAAESLGQLRDIVIDSTSASVVSVVPTGTTNTWGQSGRDIVITMSEELDPLTVENSDLVVSGTTCTNPPTVLASTLSGVSSEVITFQLSGTACAEGEEYQITFDPASVSDLGGNPGAGADRILTVTVEVSKPSILLGAPSLSRINSTGTLAYTATFTNAAQINFDDGDVLLAGASANCTASVSGSGFSTRTIAIANCSGNGDVQLSIASGVAISSYGNVSDGVDESLVIDFTADNLSLGNPTLNLPIVGPNAIYNLDSDSSFELSFAGDVLGQIADLETAHSLSCDAGGGSNSVSFTGARTSDTVLTLNPSEVSPDFIYGSTCAIAGTDVPDIAENLHTFAGIPFVVAKTPVALSGPSGLVSVSGAIASGDLGSVVFNVAMDPGGFLASATLVCDGNPIALSHFSGSAGNTHFLVDLDETDANWINLVGGETCILELSTDLTNSLGIPLSSVASFNFTTEP